MNGVIDTLNFTNSNNEISNLYPRTLVEAIANKKGESLESLLKKSNNSSSAPAPVTNSASGFTINGENLETGWYRIAAAEVMNMNSFIIGITDDAYGAYDDGDDGYSSITATLLCSTCYNLDVKLLQCQTDMDSDDYIGFDKIRVVDNAYLDIHYTSKGYETQICSITITTLGILDGDDGSTLLLPIDDNGENQFISVDEYVDFNNGSFDLDFNSSTSDEVINISGDTLGYTFTIGGGNIETGWYQIGRTIGMHNCIINIFDFNSSCAVQANVISSSWGNAMGNIKIIHCTLEGSEYIGFDKIATVQIEDGQCGVFMHYTKPDECEEQQCFITVTNLSGGEVYYDEEYTLNINMLPYNDTLILTTEEQFEEYYIMMSNDFKLKSTIIEDMKQPSQFSTVGIRLESGWYRIGLMPPSAPFNCLFHIYDAGGGIDGSYELHSNVLVRGYAEDLDIKVLDCTIDGSMPENTGFTRFDVLEHDGDDYLCGYYNNPDGTSMANIITVTNLFAGTVAMDQNNMMSFGVMPYEEIMTEPISTEVPEEPNLVLPNTNVDIVTTEDLKGIGSSHQYMLYSEGVLETGWYIIGRTMGMHSCNINIIDMGVMPGADMPTFIQANVLSSEFVEALTSNVKILDFSMFGDTPYVGFDKIATTQTEEGDVVAVMHYTNPGLEDHNCIITVTNLMGGELAITNDFSVKFGMQPYGGNTLTYLCDEFAEDALTGRISEFELKAQPDLADILARLEALETKGVSDILDPEGVEF